MMKDPKLQKSHPEFDKLKKHMEKLDLESKAPRERRHWKTPLSPGQNLDGQVPEAAKPHFKERKKPNLFDYHGVGFNVDTCLIDYKKEPTCKLITKSFLTALVNLAPANYPKEISDFDIDTICGPGKILCDVSNLGSQTVLWDLQTGCLI
jgi:hypothetical protein